jgi:hypothetical protein
MQLAAILAALSLIETLADSIPKMIAAAKQSGEMTADQEREFRDRYNAVRASDAFKTDDQLAAERMAAEGGGGV